MLAEERFDRDVASGPNAKTRTRIHIPTRKEILHKIAVGSTQPEPPPTRLPADLIPDPTSSCSEDPALSLFKL